MIQGEAEPSLSPQGPGDTSLDLKPLLKGLEHREMGENVYHRVKIAPTTAPVPKRLISSE